MNKVKFVISVKLYNKVYSKNIYNHLHEIASLNPKDAQLDSYILLDLLVLSYSV